MKKSTKIWLGVLGGAVLVGGTGAVMALRGNDGTSEHRTVEVTRDSLVQTVRPARTTLGSHCSLTSMKPSLGTSSSEPRRMSMMPEGAPSGWQAMRTSGLSRLQSVRSWVRPPAT